MFSKTLFILENLCILQNMMCGVLEHECVIFFFFFKLFGYQTPLTSYENDQFKEMVFNMPQSYILFQIIINFLNNAWYLKISLKQQASRYHTENIDKLNN